MEKASCPFYGWLAFLAFIGPTLSLFLITFNVDRVVDTGSSWWQRYLPLVLRSFSGFRS